MKQGSHGVTKSDDLKNLEERSTIIVLSRELADAADEFRVWDRELGGDTAGFISDTFASSCQKGDQKTMTEK
eukprot:15135161-Ditylum_brightwellii.AAC.1